MVHVNVNKPHHFIFFDFHPIEAMTERNAPRSIAGEFSEIDRLADFYVQDCRFLNCPESQVWSIAVIAASW